jgi:5-methylcytosine-specific restriction endonuclease McrA
MTAGRTWQIPEERQRLTRKQWADLFLDQDGKCANCGQRLEVKGAREVEIIDEHVEPLWRGGSNDLSNRELWCKPCTRPKTAAEATERAKSNRVRDKHIGAPKPKSRPIPGSRASGRRKRMNGNVEHW